MSKARNPWTEWHIEGVLCHLLLPSCGSMFKGCAWPCYLCEWRAACHCVTSSKAVDQHTGEDYVTQPVRNTRLDINKCPEKSVPVPWSGTGTRVDGPILTTQLYRETLTSPRATHRCSCPLNHHVGEYTTGEFWECFYPDLEPTCLRQMSQVNRGYALWCVARDFLVYPT